MKVPEYSIQKGHGCKDRAFVKLQSQKYYLGGYGTPESHEKYNRIVSEYLSNGGAIYRATSDLTMAELCCIFNDHAKEYYRRPDGTETSQVGNYLTLSKMIAKQYGTLPVSDFSSLKLEAVRATMINKGWTRKSINSQISSIRTIVSFGVRKELVNVSVLEALKTVRGLTRVRSAACETERIKPVPVAHVDAVKSEVNRQVRGMIQMQLHTAARPGEICSMRLCDIDMSSDVWVYKPDHHKTQHHDIERYIYIGPQAQGIVKQFIDRQPFDYLFSPSDASTEKSASASTHRRLNQRKNIRETDRVLGDCYTTRSYRRAISRACKAKKIPAWSPNQLRHNAATFIRKTYGIEAAQVMLGHSKADTTQIYAEINCPRH
jgi:integrase